MKLLNRNLRQVLHINKYFRIVKDCYSTTEGDREHIYVSKNDAIVVVPFISETEVLLIKHFRYLTGSSSLEFPAGGIEELETPLTAAKRELMEETGYSAGTYKSFGYFYPSKGISNEKVHIFSAHGLVLRNSTPDASEDILDVITLDLNKVRDKALKLNEINGSSSIIAALLILE